MLTIDEVIGTMYSSISFEPALAANTSGGA